MEFAVAAGFTWISLILFVASLSASSPFGAPVSDVFTTTIYSTESGNNTYVSYNVSKYNGTTLILSCPGEAERSAYWSRADGSALCATRNCTINSNRQLTNVDSGDYLCKTSVENGTDYQFVHINVLAPPQLQNVLTCKGKENDKCTLSGSTDIFANNGHQINVSYAGNGPFEVRWYQNWTEFTCDTFNFCEKIENGSTYQILHLRAYGLRNTMLMSGLYRAVVSNPYGTNESLIRLEYACASPDSPNSTPSKITVDLQEGSTLNVSCGIKQSSRWMYACITKNISATFADLAEDLDNCATCIDASDRGEQCSRQFNSNITSIITNSLVESDCPPVQLMNFMKSDVTVKDDDGLKIICAYEDLQEWQSYTSIHVRVYHHSSNHSHQVSVAVSAVVVSLVVIAFVVALVVASCVVLRKKRRQRDNRSDVIQDETRGLLQRTDNHPAVEPVEPLNFIPRQYAADRSDYGTVSVLEVFPQELEGSATTVTIHSASDGELGSEGRDAEFQHQSI